MSATAAVAATVVALAGHPAARDIQLTPATTRITYTAFALGLLPITAAFQRFSGTVHQDLTRPDRCSIDVTVQVASLASPSAGMRSQALAPTMLDPADFPTMHFTGTCVPHAIAGHLTLHGITRPLTLAVHRDGTRVTCVGSLARADYGIRGMSALVSSRVRIRLTVRLPS